jgi:hypothetical protein
MLRNIADAQPALVDGLDQEIIGAVAKNAQNIESLSDIMAIANRAKMSSARAKAFTAQNDFVIVVIAPLSKRAPPQLQLEAAMFVAAAVPYSEAAKTLGARAVGCVVDVFLGNLDDLDIQTQAMFAFHRFIRHTESRAALLANRGLIDAVIRHSASSNAVVSEMANAVLEPLVSFNKEWLDKIRKPRYEAFNQEWIKSIRAS